MTDSLIQDALKVDRRELRALVPALHLMIASAEVRPSQRFFLAELVDGSFARGRSALRVLTLSQVMHLRGMGDAQVSQLLNGYADGDSLRVRGLIELGMVRRRQLPDARGKAGGWLVELVADWSQWRCGFKYTQTARLNHLALLDALWAEHEAQAVAGEIVERFCLPAMLAATEIENALRLAAALRHQTMSGQRDAGPNQTMSGINELRNDVERGSHANGDAARVAAGPSQDARDQTVSGLKCERERNAPGDALRLCRSQAQDARSVPRPRDAGAVPCVTSGGPLRFVKAEGVGTEAEFMNRKASRARLSKLESELGYKTGQNNPNWRDSFVREDLKARVQGDEKEFRYAATQIIGKADWEDRSSGYAPNGVKWMLRWQAGGQHRSKAVAVFAQMLCSDFKVNETPAKAAQSLWIQFGGAYLDAARLKNFR